MIFTIRAQLLSSTRDLSWHGKVSPLSGSSKRPVGIFAPTIIDSYTIPHQMRSELMNHSSRSDIYMWERESEGRRAEPTSGQTLHTISGQSWLLLVDIKWMLSLLNNKYITVNLLSTELTDSSLSAPLFLHHSPSLPIDEMEGDRSWSPAYHYNTELIRYFSVRRQ